MKQFTDDENSIESEGRRKAVKTIVGGVAAVAAYNLMPAKWGTPVIESVFMPAHAATSGAALNDPCTVTRRSGTTATASVAVRVTGFVTPPTGGLPVTIRAAAVGGAGQNVVATTTTLADGTYAASISIGGGPGITRVNAVTTVDGVPGSASCSADIPGTGCCGTDGTMTIQNGVSNVRVQYTTCSGAQTIGPFDDTDSPVTIPDVDITQPIRVTGNNISDLTGTSNISFTWHAGEPPYYEGTIPSCGPFSFTATVIIN